MKTIELLAPAGNMDCFQAAILAGADAIYFGVGTHNARASATNFTLEEACRAIDMAHVLNVKSHITLNTLVLDREMEEIVKMAEYLNAAGADALIVQDIGLIRELRKCLPIPLHASTQMSIHNAAGVCAIKKMGLSRVVLARELTIDEVLDIQKEDPSMELEVFVHGAMCVSASGQCLHSSFLGGRSGNRGTCAQPCRLKYQINDTQAQNWLSMKDLCALDSIDQLKQAGIASLKIEGRMKPVSYIVETVSAYRAAIDGDINKKDRQERLKQVFNRGGFTSGYVSGASMVDKQYNGHRGVCVGQIIKNKMHIEKPLYAGDVVSSKLGDKTNEWHVRKDMSIGQHPIPLKGMQSGDRLWRLRSTKQDDEVQAFLHETHRTVPIDMKCIVALNQPTKLICSTVDGRACAQVEGEAAQSAKTVGLTDEKIKASLAKLGDTLFQSQTIEVVLESEALFLPNSALNALRREAIEKLEKSIAMQDHRQKTEVVLETMPRLKKESAQPRLIAQCATLAQANAAVQAGVDTIYAQPRIWSTTTIQSWSKFSEQNECYLHFPPILQGNAIQLISEILDQVSVDHFQGAIAGNFGTIEQFHMKFNQWISDYTFNIANQFAAKAMQDLGSVRTTLSAELTIAQIRDIIQRVPSMEVLVYGTLPSMNLRYCPMREANHGECIEDCARGQMLVDRKQESFCMLPFTFSKGNCLIQILNAHCLDGLKYFEDLYACNASAWRLAFYQESPSVVQERIAAYRDAFNGKAIRPIDQASGGLFGRGIV